jgi:type VI secretion system Hcp family effector
MGNSYQLGHEDEITVLSFSHSIAHDSRSVHSPIQIVKKIDKSSPVLAQACSDGEELKCRLSFYRPNEKGGDELFYEVILSGALIRSVSTHMPHVVDFNESEMTEAVSISYRDIHWRHVGANTSAFASWLQPLSDLKGSFE